MINSFAHYCRVEEVSGYVAYTHNPTDEVRGNAEILKKFKELG